MKNTLFSKSKSDIWETISNNCLEHKVWKMEEDATYNDKLREMQKYVPFLTNIFDALIKQPRDEYQNRYFEKIQILLDMITTENKRFNFQTLLRSEKALKNLYDKYEKPVKKLISKGKEVAKVQSGKEGDVVKRERTEKEDKEQINCEQKESAEKNDKTLQANEGNQSSKETTVQNTCESGEAETLVKVSSEERCKDKQNDENTSSTNVESHLPSDISDDEHFTETENQCGDLSDISDNDFSRKSPAKQRSRASSCETIYYHSEHTSVSTSSSSREIRSEYNGEATSFYKYSSSERGRVSHYSRHERKSYSRSSKSEGSDLKALEKLREKITKKLSNVDTLESKHEKRKKESKRRHRSTESFLSHGVISDLEILEEINGVSSSQNSRDSSFNRKASSSSKHRRARELDTRVVKLVAVDTGKIDSDSIQSSKSSQSAKKSLVVEIRRNKESFYEDIGDSESGSDVSNLEIEKNVPKNDLQMSTQTDTSIPDVKPITEGKPNDDAVKNASDKQLAKDSAVTLSTATNPSREVNKIDNEVKHSTSSSAEHRPTDSPHKVSELNFLDIDIDQICKTLSNQGGRMACLETSPIIILDDECDEMAVDLTQNNFEDTTVFVKDLDESIKDTTSSEDQKLNKTSDSDGKLNKTSACKDNSQCSTENITDAESTEEVLFYRRPRPQQVPTENLFLRRHQLNQLTKPEVNASNQTGTNQSLIKTTPQVKKKVLDPRLMERKVPLQNKITEVGTNDQIAGKALPPPMKSYNNVVEKPTDIAKNIICHNEKIVKDHLASTSKREDPRIKARVTNNMTPVTVQNKPSLAIKSNAACVENLLEKCKPSSNNQTDKRKFLQDSVNDRTNTKTAIVPPSNMSKDAVANKYQTPAQPAHSELFSTVGANKNLNNNLELCDDSLIDISETDIDTICEIIADKKLQKPTESKQASPRKDTTSNNNVIVEIYNNLPQNKDLASSAVVRKDLNTKKTSNLNSTDASCDALRAEKCKNIPDKTQKSVKTDRFVEPDQLKRQANAEQCKPVFTKPLTIKSGKDSKLTPTVKHPLNKNTLNSSLDVEDMANELIRALGMDEDDDTSQTANQRNSDKSKTNLENKKKLDVSHKTNAMIGKKDEVGINDKKDTNSKSHKNVEEKKHKSIEPEISKRNDKKISEKSFEEQISASDRKERGRKLSNLKENSHKSNKSDQPKSKGNQDPQKRPRSVDDKKDNDVMKKKSAKMEQTLKDIKNDKSSNYKEKVMDQNSKAPRIKDNSSDKKTKNVIAANTGKLDKNEKSSIIANVNESKESNNVMKKKKPSLTPSSGKSLDKVKDAVKITNDTVVKDKMPRISTEIREEIAHAVDECLANVLEHNDQVTPAITEANLPDANSKKNLQTIQKPLQTGSRELLSLSKDLRDSFICKDLENLGSRRKSSINAEMRLKNSLLGMEIVERSLRSQSLKRKVKPSNLEILAPVVKKQRLDTETLSSDNQTLAKYKIQDVKVVLQRLTIEEVEDAESRTAKRAKMVENSDSTNDEIPTPPNPCLLEPTKEAPVVDRLQESPPRPSKKNKLIRNVDRSYHSQCEDNEVCKLCHMHFLDSTNLVNHYVNKHRSVEVLISRLSEEDINLLLRRAPLATVEGDRFRGECVFCKNLIVHRKSAWIEHIFSHTGEYFYECSTCNNRAIRISDIEHLAECENDQNVSKIFSYDFDPDEIVLYGCKHCNYVQYSRDKMLDHISRHHKRARSMQHINHLVVMKFPKPESSNDPTMEEEGEIIFQVHTCPLEKLIVKCEDYSHLDEEQPLEVDPLDLGPLDQSETMRFGKTSDESSNVIQNNCESDKVKVNGNDIFENLIEPITMTKSPKASKTSNALISTSPLRNNYATNRPDENMIVSAECLSDHKPPLGLVPDQPISTKQTKVDFGNVLPEKFGINKVVNLGYSLPKACSQLFYCFIRGCRFKFTRDLDDLQTHVVKMHNDIIITEPCSVCETSINFSTWPAKLIDEVNHIRQYHSISRPLNPITSNNAFTNDIVRASENNCTQPTYLPKISSGQENDEDPVIISTKLNDPIVVSDDDDDDDEREPAGPVMEITKAVIDSQETQSSVTFKHVLEVLKPWIRRTRSQKPLDLCIPLLQVEHLKRLFKCMGDNCIFSTDSFHSMLEHCDRHKCYYEAHASRSSALMYKSWLECAYCDYFNRDAPKFVRHVMDAHKRVGFQCGECFYRAQSMPEVLQHQRSIHKDKIKFRIIRLKMETVTPRPCVLLAR